MQSPLRSKILSLFVIGQLSLASLLLPSPAHAESKPADTQHFDISAGKLDQVLNQFALEAGIRLHLNAELSRGLESGGLQGQYSVSQGFARLLANTSLYAHRQPDGAYRVSSAMQQGATELAPINVEGRGEIGLLRDKAGYEAVFDEDVSTVYTGKDKVERFKGTDAADLFQGMANTFSADGRNGGGIDPNIRGFQGPGRVPVTIDGTEQAITVWRGYRGASNRSYIDPNLIASIKVHKGPSITPNVHTSVGGAVEITTITAGDVVQPGERFGVEFKMEGSNNSVDPRLPTLLTGQDYREVPEYEGLNNIFYVDPTLRVQTDDDGGGNPFSGGDYSYRLAVGSRLERFDFLGAYAYRSKGNYFSGTRNPEFYETPIPEDGQPVVGRQPVIRPEHMALSHLPGHEVPNTSSEMESWLFKGTYSFSNSNKLEMGIRLTDSTYGEIMASRTGARTDDGLAQWPLSNVRMQAYNVKHRWSPRNDWLDWTANVWTTLTKSNTNTAGGAPNDASQFDPIIRNTAAASSREERYGLDFSNKMRLLKQLDLTLSGSYQNHQLRPSDGLPSVDEMVVGSGAGLRAGSRRELNGSFMLDWRPTDFMVVSIGARYGSYSLTDDYVNNRIEAGDTQSITSYMNQGFEVHYQTAETYTDEEMAERLRIAEEEIALLPSLFPPFIVEILRQGILAEAQNPYYDVIDYDIQWLRDEQGRFSRADNPCLTGVAQNDPKYLPDSCRMGSTIAFDSVLDSGDTLKDKGWMPSLSMTFLLSDNDRLYMRYTEARRFLSLFEGTRGFSAVANPYSPLKPERARNFEAAYIRYFANTSVKLTYFDQKISDVLDRGEFTSFNNLEEQTIRGLEFQGSYDNGRFFTNLSLAYNLENEVCDEHVATLRSADRNFANPTPNCVRAGFASSAGGSYLSARSVPPYSANWLLGGRFLENSMELGLRLNVVAGSHDDDPVQRDDATTFDAYFNYRVTDRITAEFVGTNLGDLYYIEPMAISSVPAPGRTAKFSVAMKF